MHRVEGPELVGWLARESSGQQAHVEGSPWGWLVTLKPAQSPFRRSLPLFSHYFLGLSFLFCSWCQNSSGTLHISWQDIVSGSKEALLDSGSASTIQQQREAVADGLCPICLDDIWTTQPMLIPDSTPDSAAYCSGLTRHLCAHSAGSLLTVSCTQKARQ